MNYSTLGPLILLSSLLVVASEMTSGQQKCPNLSPCTCDTSFSVGSIRPYLKPNDIRVNCVRVPMAEVKSAFSNLTVPFDFEFLQLWILPSESLIPADILGQSRLTNELELYGNSVNPQTVMVVDPNAFRSSKNTLQRIFLMFFDSSKLDLKFLTGFNKIYRILFGTDNIHRSLPTLPALPSLTSLDFWNANGLNETWRESSGNIVLQTDVGLTALSVSGSGLDEKTLVRLLDWILPSSENTLSSLEIESFSELSSIPKELNNFKELKYFHLRFNWVDLILSRDSFFMQNVTYESYYSSPIQIVDSKLVRVESGAFQGNYTNTNVNLRGNLLTRFEEGAFKSMLQDMFDSGGNKAHLDVSWNPFDCYSDPCHLAWLLRDNRNFLDTTLVGANCIVNDEAFKDVRQNLFDKCALM